MVTYEPCWSDRWDSSEVISLVAAKEWRLRNLWRVRRGVPLAKALAQRTLLNEVEAVLPKTGPLFCGVRRWPSISSQTSEVATEPIDDGPAVDLRRDVSKHPVHRQTERLTSQTIVMTQSQALESAITFGKIPHDRKQNSSGNRKRIRSSNPERYATGGDDAALTPALDDNSQSESSPATDHQQIFRHGWKCRKRIRFQPMQLMSLPTKVDVDLSDNV